MFTEKYLSLNTQEMSQEYGCCELHLSETKDNSVFVIEPASGKNNMLGLTVDYSDFFTFKSKKQDSPFFLHVFKKISDTDFEKQDKSYNLNASQDSSIFKAKLFMSYEE